MNDKTLSNRDRIFWLTMQQRISMSEYEVPITRQRAQQLQAQLPPRNSDESVGEWIRRASQPHRQQTSSVPMQPQQAQKLQYLAQFVQLAADQGDTEYTLPEPEWTYESEDGRWRLKIQTAADTIRLDFQALSYAVDDFAGQNVILWDETSDQPFASIKLDQDGDGCCELLNTLAVRKALCHPYVLIEVKE